MLSASRTKIQVGCSTRTEPNAADMCSAGSSLVAAAGAAGSTIGGPISVESDGSGSRRRSGGGEGTTTRVALGTDTSGLWPSSPEEVPTSEGARHHQHHHRRHEPAARRCRPPLSASDCFSAIAGSGLRDRRREWGHDARIEVGEPRVFRQRLHVERRAVKRCVLDLFERLHLTDREQQLLANLREAEAPGAAARAQALPQSRRTDVRRATTRPKAARCAR